MANTIVNIARAIKAQVEHDKQVSYIVAKLTSNLDENVFNMTLDNIIDSDPVKYKNRKQTVKYFATRDFHPYETMYDDYLEHPLTFKIFKQQCVNKYRETMGL